MTFIQKTFISTIVLSLFGVSIYFFIIQPTIADIKNFNDRIQIERVSLENKYTSRRNIKNIIADVSEIKEQLTDIEDKMIIKSGEEVGFIRSLENIASLNNLVQKISLRPTDEQEINLATKYNITINLAGDYIDTLKYLRDMEASDFYIIIYGVNITSNKNNKTNAASSGNVKTNLYGYVYFSI
ncbi:MAG: hypothetical protein COU51_02405 [Parcubacteria group bacterium CG10_big_fil_rev_8_21_14_0_10_36_14]|nr:MAG: hypothetical protein COU51_02405 [Parcubacteria group bacterium CG10_big_fil_rev_8_21_14_0_10_36_14]